MDERVTYAPLENETGAAYAARLDKIKNPNAIALKAGKLIAKAMETIEFTMADPKADDLDKAFQRIASVLGEYDQLMAIREDEARLAQMASDHFKQTGDTVKNNAIKSLLQRTGDRAIVSSLDLAASEAWAAMKESLLPGEENVGKKQMLSVLKRNSSEYELVSSLYEFRERARAMEKGNQ